MTCSLVLQAEGKPYPKTCEDHGLMGCTTILLGTPKPNIHPLIVEPTGGAATFRNRRGVWMIYGYDELLEIPYITNSLLDATLRLTREYRGSIYAVGFWPHGMKMNEAVIWWRNEAGRDLEAEWVRDHG